MLLNLNPQVQFTGWRRGHVSETQAIEQKYDLTPDQVKKAVNNYGKTVNGYNEDHFRNGSTKVYKAADGTKYPKGITRKKAYEKFYNSTLEGNQSTDSLKAAVEKVKKTSLFSKLLSRLLSNESSRQSSRSALNTESLNHRIPIEPSTSSNNRMSWDSTVPAGLQGLVTLKQRN